MPRGDLNHPQTIIQATPGALDIYLTLEDSAPEGTSEVLGVLLSTKTGKPNKGLKRYTLDRKAGVGVANLYGVLEFMVQHGMVVGLGVPARGTYTKTYMGFIPVSDLAEVLRWAEMESSQDPRKVLFKPKLGSAYRKLSSGKKFSEEEKDVIFGALEEYGDKFGHDSSVAIRARSEAKAIGGYQ